MGKQCSMEIIKVIIKGESGFGPVDTAYKDRLEITKNAISYEFCPGKENNTDVLHRWSYKTDSLVFARIFEEIVEMLPRYLDSDEKLMCSDMGSTTITVVYEDKTRRTESYYCPTGFFRDLYLKIRLLIPYTEPIPNVILLSED